MDDVTTYALLTASFFFVALAFALLIRYRQVSQKINASTDLGHDLWSSLEQRLRKQDERILDMMGRLEVVQSRVMTAAAMQAPPLASIPAPSPSPPAPTPDGPPVSSIESTPMTQQAEAPKSQESQPPQVVPQAAGVPMAGAKLDPTQLKALAALRDAPKSTPDIVKALEKSREHTARLMKELFGLGLVSRNDSTKPFVYQLTEEGRKRLPP